MKTLLVAVNCSYSHSSLAIPYLRAAHKERLPSVPLPVAKEYYLRQDPESIADEIALEQPDLIGFSCYIFNLPLITELALLARRRLPRVKILFGGPEMADGGADCLAKPGVADFAIRDEGELSFVSLIQRLNDDFEGDMTGIDGVAWKDGETVVVNQPAEPIEPLDMIPSPFQARLNRSDKPSVLLEASRGCPFRCDFCLSGGSGRVREFSLERVFADIDAIAGQGIEEIKFVDRTFNVNAARASAILEYIESRHPDMRVHVEIEPTLLHEPGLVERLDREKIHVEIGLQDLSPTVLSKVNRRSPSLAAIKSVRRLCEESKARVHLDLIAGLPGGTLEGLYRNVTELIEFGPNELQLELLKVLKGTALRESAELVYSTDPPYTVLATADMSRAELDEARLLSRLVDMFYNDRHLGPVAKRASRLVEGFWKRFLRWWLDRGYPAFGIAKTDRFDRLLSFSRSALDRADRAAREELFAQWAFRRLCYARLRARRDLEGVAFVRAGKLPATAGELRSLSREQLSGNLEKYAGSWSLCRFAADPLAADHEIGRAPSHYLWVWNNQLRPADSACQRFNPVSSSAL